MGLPRTLWWYIGKEMGKVFLLTSVGMTLVLGLGGGVFNIIELGEASSAQLFRILMLMLPMMAALTLPIAALYAATVTYGRFSADNEFVACRASGINIHSLFMPAAVLSLVSALITFVFINFVVPGMFRNLAAVVTPDMGRFLTQRLNRPKGLPMGKGLRIKAHHARVDASDPGRVVVEGVAIANLKDGEWLAYGTARRVSIRFTDDQGRPRISVVASDVSYWDREKGYLQIEEMPFDTELRDEFLELKLKFLDLFELIHLWRQPEQWRETVAEVERLRLAVGGSMILDSIWDDWKEDGLVVFDDGRTRFELRSQADGGRIERDGTIVLSDATIEEFRDGGRTRRTITASEASIEIERADSLDDAQLIIRATDVSFSDGGRAIEKNAERIGPLPMPEDVLQRAFALSGAALLDGTNASAERPVVVECRRRALDKRDEVARKIAGIMHERLTYSISVLGLVILGAGLGIVFRGAHVVTAFGISFVPLLFVIVAIVAGKQLAGNAGSHIAGLAVMWSGIFVVGGIDVWTLAKLVRR